MQSSIHPPLYLLVAVISFYLGSFFSAPDSPATSSTTDSGQRDGTASSASSAITGTEPEAVYVASGSEGSAVGDTRPETAVRNARPPSEPDSTASPVTANPDVKANPEPVTPRGPVLKTAHGDIEIFPADNPWNTDISQLPVHEYSRTWIQSIGLDKGLHPDFGTVWNGAPSGIPFVVIPPGQPGVKVQFEYPDESDPGPYPVPPDAPIEGGPDAPQDSDRHVIVLDPQQKRLYELFHCFPQPGGGWIAGSGAIFDLTSNRLRPAGWTSADAAGLPILPGLVKFDEVESGEVRHAFRFTVRQTQRAYILPATHWASRSHDRAHPPMGLRVRLRADYDLSGFPPRAQVILTALKKYGMLLADNGSDWFISGSPDPRWDDEELNTIKRVKGRDLECVLTGPLVRDQRP